MMDALHKSQTEAQKMLKSCLEDDISTPLFPLTSSSGIQEKTRKQIVNAVGVELFHCFQFQRAPLCQGRA